MAKTEIKGLNTIINTKKSYKLKSKMFLQWSKVKVVKASKKIRPQVVWNELEPSNDLQVP